MLTQTPHTPPHRPYRPTHMNPTLENTVADFLHLLIQLPVLMSRSSVPFCDQDQAGDVRTDRPGVPALGGGHQLAF